MDHDFFIAPPVPDLHVASPSTLGMESAEPHAVEIILNYRFRDKQLLVGALTHPSYAGGSVSYQRLEFIGDAALGLAFSNYVFLTYPELEPGQMSLLRAANISTEKLARVAVKHGLYAFVKRNSTALDDMVKEFTKAVSQEDNAVSYGGLMKAPKILADIVESLAAAVYVDVNFDLQRLWVIFRGLLEPIVTLEDIQQQPQPVTLLFEFCQKHEKQLDFVFRKNESKIIASVYVDGALVASASSKQKEIAKLSAAREALHKFSQSIHASERMFGTNDGIDTNFENGGAKQKLHDLCGKKKWANPNYSIEKDDGPPHKKKYVCSVKIPTADGVLYMMGDEKSRVKEAENSAASLMIRSLQEAKFP